MRGKSFTFAVVLAAIAAVGWLSPAIAAPLPGGTLDPLTIPKYVTPLVIPPVMANYSGIPNKYRIAVRQFQQQILPTGFGSTKVWSYGAATDPIPTVAPAAGSSFNYPAFTVETTANTPVDVRWLNELVAIDPTTKKPYPVGNAARTFLPHLLWPSVDQTLHWANPPATGCADPMNPSQLDPMNPNRTDCHTLNPAPYTGPVPIVTHLHGAHVEAHSDGYPEAWWLPAATGMTGYATKGSHFGDATGTNPGNLGYADYAYRNDQPATTLWYHDHSLGITRLNVYAGPAGFWLVRGGLNGDSYVDDSATSTLNDGVLPGPPPLAGDDPNFTATTRNKVREVPIVIQDRSFNADGSLFYPASRTFFDGFTGPYIPTSDIAPIWNPEAFFNTMVVNGSTWPTFDVAPASYRLRLLNGCNSRTLNLALFWVIKDPAQGTKQKNAAKLNGEIPFYQIGSDQGFLPNVVMLSTGFATVLPGNGTIPAPVATADPARALLMGPAERADVIVDFSGLPDGTIVRMINTAPDAPFGGFPDVPADPSTTGQVMQFVVRTALLNAPGSTDGTTTPPQNLILPAEGPLGTTFANTRQVSLNEMMSDQVCVQITPSGTIRLLFTARPNDPTFMSKCTMKHGVPMGPRQALLGTFSSGATGVATPRMWSDAITETPTLGTMESWEIFNTTVDAHPIHLHLVKFQVIDRQPLDPLTMLPTGVPTPPAPTEMGYKDTVVTLPGQVTRIKAVFDIAGLYVWHCHILEHEDNEMMRPYMVQ